MSIVTRLRVTVTPTRSYEMPKYIVTGGETGEASIEVAGKTYEVGDAVELKATDWLIKAGYVRPVKPTKGDK